jgi:hypothetical protein
MRSCSEAELATVLPAHIDDDVMLSFIRLGITAEQSPHTACRRSRASKVTGVPHITETVEAEVMPAAGGC